MPMRLFLLALVLATMTALTGCLNSSPAVLGNVTGKVYDSNGHVLRGAKVELYGGDHTVLTDELGRYSIVNADPGSKRLVATWQNRSVVVNIEIPRGGTLENIDITFTTVDQLPPVITDVQVASLSENAAAILWKTNELADSFVDYATGPIGLGTYTYLASDSAMLLDHSIALATLSPNIGYHFRVRSHDFAGNEGVSSDYQFTTPGGEAPASPTSFAIAAPTEMERVLLTWNSNTEQDLQGYNLYRSDSKNGPFSKVNANPITSASSTGLVAYRDEGLKIAWKYYYYVKAVDTARNESAPSNTLSVVTPGSLSEDRLWKAEESPYILTGDLRIRGGTTLTLEPGVEVRFSMSDSLPDSNGASMTDLIVQGALKAVGTPDRRIIMTSAETFPRRGNWGGVKFSGTNDPNNQMNYVTLTFADTGIRSEGSTPSIQNVEIGLCVFGLDLGLSTALNPRYNVIRDCNVGLVSSNSNIRNNLFVNNQTAASLMGADMFEHNTIDGNVGVEISFGTPTVKNNIFTYVGSGHGLYGVNQTQPLATPTISFNDFYNMNSATNGVTVATGPGNIASDPLFIGNMPYDYHLQTVAAGYASNSPCLTAGESGVQMGRYGP
ncbi:MAG: carboxypeptidase regulatory-like domain-containing protein [Candidatus Riflebacteria bacterium]|nr:carboxypeptidase regulatory-like domain-containing protein [Candidatus Riflebacteria bacterium]